MAYKYSTLENRQAAKRLLDTLRKEAEAKMADTPKGAIIMEEVTPQGANTMAYARISNVAGVHIYQVKAGWYADFVLARTAPGVASVFGTPTDMPHQTFEQARAEALQTVELLIDNEAHPLPEPTTAVFSYHSLDISIPIGLLKELRADPDADHGPYATSRLAEIDAELGDFTKETFDSLPNQRLARYLAVFSIALLAGIPRWPPSAEPTHAPGHA